MTKRRWASVAVGISIFLAAFGIALAQQLFQVSREVPADLEGFEAQVLPDGQLRLEFRDGTPVDHLGFRKLDIQQEERAGNKSIFITNETDPPIRLLVTDPCHPAVDSATAQEVGFFFADLSSGWRWNVVAGEWRVPEYQNEEYAGHTCDDQRPAEWRLLPGQTYRMEIGLKLHSEFASGPGNYDLNPVVIGGVGPEMPAPEPIQPPGGMVGWWPADGNVEDIIGGNHGAPPFADFVEGMVQQGFGLDGSGDHILVPDNNGDLNITGDVTVDLWARRTVFGEGIAVMVGKGADNIGTSDAPYAIVFNTGDELVAGFFNGDGSGAALLGPTVRDTDFHHYAYARSGDTHKLFMDGRDATILTYESFSDGSEIIGNPSDPFTARPGDTSGLPFVIGAFRNGSDPTGFDFHFGGVIDEVEVFNRALSADEIRAIYEAGSAGKIKPPPPEPIPPPAGIVGWWPGDEDASDIVGGVNGTPQNGATFAPGLVGQAFSLDGSDDFVSLPDDAFDALFAGGEISIEAWMKTGGVASQSSDSKSGIAAAWDFTAVMFESSWWLYFDFAEIGVITAVWDGVWGNRLSSATFISDDNWHHVASTYSGGTARIYVDGVLRASEPRNLANGVTNRFSGGAFNNYPGLLDEITLYNRALTAEEIRAIYEAGSAGKIKPPAPEPIPPPAGMVSWWPGDGNANDIWDGNPGTLQGGAGFTPGMVDQAFSFDSDDDRVTIAHNPNLNVPPAGFTVDFWMRGSPSQPDSHFLVVDKSHGWVDSTGWVFQGISANGNLFFAIGAGGAGNTDFRGVESLASVLDNQFHYVAGTWDGGTIRLYVDSVLQGTAALEVPANNARPVNIAFSWGGGPPRRFFRGSVDEIGLFSRALTPEEIRAIYQAGSAGKIKPENTITLPNLGNRGYIFSTQELTGSGDADQDRDIWWNNVELVGSMQSLGVYPNLDSLVKSLCRSN